jgi:hypothetical protein
MSANKHMVLKKCNVCQRLTDNSVSRVFHLCSKECLEVKINSLELNISDLFVKSIFNCSLNYGDFLKRVSDFSTRHKYDFYATYIRIFEIQKKLNINNRGFRDE